MGSEGAGCHACEPLTGIPLHRLQIPHPFRSWALSSSRSRQTSHSRASDCLQCCILAVRCRAIFSVSELECFAVPRHLLLQSLQHSSRKFIGRYGNKQTKKGKILELRVEKTEMREFIFLATVFLSAITKNMLKLIRIFQAFGSSAQPF